MDYKIEILEFDKDCRGFLVGRCDIKVIYSEEKWEIFRNIGIFQKENRRWLSFPKMKKIILDEESEEQKTIWVQTYERNPPLDKGILPEVLVMLEDDYL